MSKKSPSLADIQNSRPQVHHEVLKGIKADLAQKLENSIDSYSVGSDAARRVNLLAGSIAEAFYCGLCDADQTFPNLTAQDQKTMVDAAFKVFTEEKITPVNSRGGQEVPLRTEISDCLEKFLADERNAKIKVYTDLNNARADGYLTEEMAAKYADPNLSLSEDDIQILYREEGIIKSDQDFIREMHGRISEVGEIIAEKSIEQFKDRNRERSEENERAFTEQWNRSQEQQHRVQVLLDSSHGKAKIVVPQRRTHPVTREHGNSHR